MLVDKRDFMLPVAVKGFAIEKKVETQISVESTRRSDEIIQPVAWLSILVHN